MIAAIERLTGLEWKGQGTVFLVASGHGGTHWIAATFYLLLPFITRDLGLSYAEAGMLVAVFHLSAFTANFASGLVVDVTGKRVVYQVASLAVGAAALLGCGGAQSLLWLFPMVVLIGATNNLWHPPAISFLSEHFPRQRGYALSIHALGASVGDALAPLAAGALLYVGAATAVGLLISTFMRSQIAAIFGTAVLTILPAANFSGMIDPVSSLEGVGRVIGEIYPTTHFLTIARGTFSKALNFSDLHAAFLPLALAVPVLIGLSAALLKKQER